VTVKDKFTPEEWFKVMNGPGRAGVAVMASSPSGITGFLAEANALANELQTLIRSHPSTPLLADMADAYQHTTREELKEQRDAAGENVSRDVRETKDQALESVRQAVWLVSTKTTAEDTRAYKDLLMRVAQRVAEAATEGGFLGIGGVRVSDAEQAVLDELRQMLQ